MSPPTFVSAAVLNRPGPADELPTPPWTVTADQAETLVLAAAERWRHREGQRELQAMMNQPLDQLTAEERDWLTRGLRANARLDPQG